MSSSPSKTSIIFSGELFDGKGPTHPQPRDRAGVHHIVRVRAMPARHMRQVFEFLLDEAALLELVCQLGVPNEKGDVTEWQPVDATWVDNLDDESHAMLFEAAKRQNFTRAAIWGERQIAAKQFQAPLILKADEALGPVINRMVGLLTSSLQSSASPARPVSTTS